MQKGMIVHYDSDRGFGFILVGNTSVFFHNTRQRDVAGRGSEPLLLDYWTEKAKKGEAVLVEIGSGPKGPRAECWVKQANWDRAAEEIAARGTLRLRRRTGVIPISRLQEKPKFETLWEGTSLIELENRWPRQYWPLHNQEDRAMYLEQWQADLTWAYYPGDPR